MTSTNSNHIKRVKVWAAKYDLNAEVDILINNGFENLQSLSLLTESDLDAMGFTKIGTKKKIMAAVSEINCKITKLRDMGGSLAEIHNIAYANEAEIQFPTPTPSPTPTPTPTPTPKHEPTGDELLDYFEIRKAIIPDIPQITEIFNYYCKNNPEITAEEHEKPESYFVELFQQQDEKHPILVQVLTKPLFDHHVGTVISYIFIGRFSTRSAYDNVGEFSMYLHPQFKSKGLGTALVVVSTKFCYDHGINKIVNRVSSTNIASIKAQEKMGFTKVATLPEIFTISGKENDTYFFQKDLLKDKEKDIAIISQILQVIHQNVVKV